MRKYDHDTYYFGYDILSVIKDHLGKPSMDRGGIYIWVQNNSDNSDKAKSTKILFYNANENDGRGALEIHKSDGFVTFVDQIDYYGVLDLNADKTDCVFNKEKLEEFLKKLN